MRIFLLLIVGAMLTSPSIAKQYTGDFEWDEKPILDTFKLDQISEDEVGLIREVKCEMLYSEAGDLEEYVYTHYMVYVNSEEAVERNNKIYVGVSEETLLLEHNARVISKDGSIKELGEESLLEGKDEDESTYKYFAITGAEIGSVIEFYYVIKRSPRFYGHYVKFQRSVPIKNWYYELTTPDILDFAFLSQNGLPEMEADTTCEECNRWSLTAINVPKEYDEYFANNGGNEMILMYHLYGNLGSGATNIFNYSKVTANIYEPFLEEQPKKVLKKLSKLTKPLKLSEISDTREKVLAIEHAVKTNYRILDIGNPSFSNLSTALDMKVLNENGASKVFYHIFKQEGIDFELVVTSNRYDLRFHPTFEDYSFLDKYLIHITEVGEFMDPGSAYNRLGTIPHGYIHSHGLFISEISLGGSTMPMSEIKFIDAPADTHTQSNMDITATFNEDFTTTTVQLNEEKTGYYALNTQPYIGLLDEDADKEIRESHVKSVYEEAKIVDLKIINGGAENVGKLPLVVEAKVESAEFTERAGPKILFKVGDLIGPQAEMYQEEERKLPVENSYNRVYNRSIKFEIPEGYTCKNLSSLDFNVEAALDDHISSAFYASYKIQGNQVEVTIEEFYRDIFLPIEHYEPYREVINAAADFNKVVLVFEPK